MKYCILLLVVATALGVPIYPDAEDVQCNSLFQYKKQYVFTYTGTTETGVVGTHDETANTRITCQEVTVRVPQMCVVILNTRSCDIEPRTEQTRQFATNLERYELMARVQNGLIVEVMPHVEETLEVLNVKRGILSALQMQWNGQVEEEVVSNHLSVHGNCSATTTHVENNDDVYEEFVVNRDLNTCTHKPKKSLMMWPGLSYLQNMNIGSRLINSSQICRYETYHKSGQHMQRAECQEVHSFWPMSISSDRGIMTTITQVLEQQSLERLNSLDFKALRYDKRSTDIVQGLPRDETVEEMTADEAMEFIKDLVKSTLDEVKMDTPRKFGYWVKALKSLNNDSMHEVFERTYNCEKYSEECANTVGKPELAREYLWDGLLQCGTLPCFSVVNTAIMNNIIPKPLAHVMMYTMAFRDFPTIDLIAEGVRLAKVNRTRSTFLPLSTMIYNYWVDHPEMHSERELPKPMVDFLDLINNIINDDCTVIGEPKSAEAVEEERQILLAIKALGNLGPVAQKYDENEFRKRLHFERELLKCANNPAVSFNITLNSVQALRRFNSTTMSSSVTGSLKEAFMSTTYDVELRIAAYLIFMKSNVDTEQLIDVYRSLKSEPVKQFKAFTFTHIANILESEAPSVQKLRKELILAIGEEEFPEYPKNIFKYSRNIEISKVLTLPYFNKTFGGSIESNIIYNPETIMPKSIMIKNAASALGQEWELIEAGLEVQGFEAVLESIFGPAGFFPSNVMRTMVRKADELIVSKIRKSSSLSLDWLARIMDVLKSPTPIKDIQTARTNSLVKTLDNVPVAEPEPEPSMENGLSGDMEENLANINDIVNKEQKERLATIYLRVLGNELGFLTLDDIKSLVPSVDRQMIADMITELGSKLAEGVNLNTTRSVVFLNRELVLPTGIGMPLNCSTNGTLVVSLRSRGQLSINLPSATVSGRIAPSAGMELLGTMGIHVPTTKIHAGVMANASVYHSSDVQGNVTINGPHLKFQLKALEKPVNLLNFSVNYFLLKPNGEMNFIPGIMNDAVRYEECANPGKLLGVSLCLAFAYPNASYAEAAPRFPLAGPLSFNISLNSVDQTLGAYTFEAKYKQIAKSANSGKPVKNLKGGKKSFGAIGKKTAYVAPEEVIDTIEFNFTAPGESLRRDIITKLVFHRNKTEATWAFDIPEFKGLQVFAGLLNLTDTVTGQKGMQLVWNATYNEVKSSVSFTLKDSSVVDTTNYTAVFNSSVQQLHYAVVGQYIDTGTFMIASINDTYYWDDETPIYDQLTWLTSGYTINPEKYRHSVALMKTLTNGPEIDRTVFISSMGQNFTVESMAMNLPESYSNEIATKFENSFVDLPLVDITYQHDAAERMGTKVSYRYIDVHRGENVIFYQEDGEKELDTYTMSRDYTFGIKTTQKVVKRQFADITDQDFLEKFGEDIYEMRAVNLNTTMHFTLKNETVTEPTYFTSLNMTVSVPKSLDLSEQTRWGMGYTARVVKELSTPEKNFGYILQLNNTIPILLLDFSNEITLRNTTEEGIKVTFSHETLERKYGKHMNIDMFNQVDVVNMKMKNGINFASPYYNYNGGSVVALTDDLGMVIKNTMGQEGGVIPSITDFLQDYYFTMKLWQNISVGFHLTNKIVNISTDHLIHIDGPVTNFELRLVPFFVRDLINKTYYREFDAMKTSILEVSYKITNSSIQIGNDLFIKTPYIMNVTMDHDLFLDANRINHSMIVRLKRPSVNLIVDYLLQGPEDTFFTVSSNVIGNIGTITDLKTTLDGKAKFGKALNSNLVFNSIMKTPKIANVTTGGTFIIKGMKEYTKFDTVEMSLSHEIESILGQSYMTGSVKFDTFKRLFKFAKSAARVDGRIISRFFNWTSESGIEGSGFNEITEFERMNTTTKINIASPLLNFNLKSSSEVNEMEGMFVAGSVGTSHMYHIESVLGNVDYNLGYSVMDVSSPVNFELLNGTTDFSITSRLINVTTSNTMHVHGVENIFHFELVNGSMTWNVDSVLGNAVMVQNFELNNFRNLTNFDSATAGMDYAMQSEYLGRTHLALKYGIYGMSGLLQFKEANTSLEMHMTNRFIDTSLTSSGKIKTMTGLLNYGLMTGKAQYNTVSSFFNMTGTMSATTSDMDGFFVFSNMNSVWAHESNTPFTTMMISYNNDWVNSVGFLNHDTWTTIVDFSFNTPIGIIESHLDHSLDNSDALFKFGEGTLGMSAGITSKYLNITTGSLLTGNGFVSLLQFDQFRFTTDFEASLWKVMSASASMVRQTSNMNGLTVFSKFLVTQNATISTPVAVANVMRETNMVNMRGIFDYDLISNMAGINMESRLVNFASGMMSDVVTCREFLNFDSFRFGLSTNITWPTHTYNNSIAIEVTGMEKLTTSSKIAGGIINRLTSKLISMDSATGFHLLGQSALFQFDNAAMGTNISIVTPIVTMASAIGSEMVGSMGWLHYNKLMMGSSGSLNSTVVSMKGDAGLEILDQNGLLNYNKASFGATTDINNKLANITFGTESTVLNHIGFMQFADYIHNTTISFVSKPQTMMRSYQTNIRRSTGLFRNELIDMTMIASSSGLITSTDNLGFTVTNSAGIGIYDKLHLTHAMNLITKFLNTTSTTIFTVTQANGLLTFVKGVGNSDTVITIPIGEAQIVGAVAMNDFRGFMKFTGMTITGKIDAGTMMTTMAGAEFVNFQGPFVFDRMNASLSHQNTNSFVNYTGNMVMEVLNSGGIFNVNKALLTTGQNLNSRIVSYTSNMHLEANNVESLTNFVKVNATRGYAIRSVIGDVTTVSALVVGNVRSILEVGEVSVTSNTGIVSSTANVTTGVLYTIRDITGLMTWGEVKLEANATAITILGNLDSINSMTINNMNGFMKLMKMKMNTVSTFTGPIGNVDLSGQMILRNLVNMTTFKLFTTQYNMLMVTKPLNINSVASLNVQASRNIFDVELIEGSMVHNVSTPYSSTNMSSAVMLREMTGLNTFNDLSVSHEMKMRTPLTDSAVVLTIGGMTSWGNVVQKLDTTLITSKGSIQVAQQLDYENAKVSVTIPTYGYIHLHGHLNEMGDELTIKMKHILESKSPEMVEDFSLLLKLNQSDVIYTNFSWNPEVIAEVLDISTGALNSTINFTMTTINQTQIQFQKAMNASRQRLIDFNTTIYEILENPRMFLEKYNVNMTMYDEIKEKVLELKEKVQRVLEFSRDNPREALKNAYEVGKATAEQAINITRVTYGKMDERFMLQEKIEKVNQTIQDIISYIASPKVTWNLIKPKLEELLANVTELIQYELIKTKFNDIVDIPRFNQTLREYLNEISIVNLKTLVEEIKLLINSSKVTETMDALKSVELNVGCVTFKDLSKIDMERINSTYIKIKEILQLDNLKQFVNISQLEIITARANRTLLKNIDLEAWNQTLHDYINIPLLNTTLMDLSTYTKEKVNKTVEIIKEKVNAKAEELKIKYDEMKVVVKLGVQMLNDTMMEISGLNWEELKDKVGSVALQLNETMYEKVDMTNVKEILKQLKQNVTSRINMTKINLAVDKLNNTLNLIIAAAKNETHPINFLSMKYYDTTIFDLLEMSLERLVEASDNYGEKAFEMLKEYGQKTVELYKIYHEKTVDMYKVYRNITMVKAMELYENATELYENYSIKMEGMLMNFTEVAATMTEEWKVRLSEYVERANRTVLEIYNEYSPVIYEVVSNKTEQGMIIARNITAVLVEKSKPYVVKAVELLNNYKNNLLLQSTDVCINVTTLIEDTIERLPEFKEMLLKKTKEYLELNNELYKNITIYLNKTRDLTKEKLQQLNDWRIEYMDKIIEMTKNEENLLNYYPVEWTGKTVNVLSIESVETLNTTLRKLREQAKEKLEELKEKAQDKVEELKTYLANKEHLINKYPVEYLGMSVMEIYEDIKQNVTELVEQGKEYIEVAREVVNGTIMAINNTLIEYNITRERLEHTIVQVVDVMNETLNNFTRWIEVARQQPYNVTIEQIVEFANETAIRVLELSNKTIDLSLEIADKTLNYTVELWNNLTRQENLDKIPIYVDKIVAALNETIILVNQTIQDIIGRSKKAVSYIREEAGIIERIEGYREKIEELKTNVTKYLNKIKDYTEEILVSTKKSVTSKSSKYVEYFNYTLPGWMYRYYEVEKMPFQLWNYTTEEGSKTFFKLSNTTKVFVKEFVDRFVQFNMDDNSLTVTFTHPFNWTSFRQLPTLTDAQLEVLITTKEEIINRLILPSKLQIERLTELITTRYEELMAYINSKIEENRPVIEEKLSELREKIQETRQKIEKMRAEFNWIEFKRNVTDKYTEARELIKGNVTLAINKFKQNYPAYVDRVQELGRQIKENVTEAMNDLKLNYPAYIERVQEMQENITVALRRYQEEFPGMVSDLLEQVSKITKELYLPTDLPPLIKPWTYTSMIFGVGHVMTFDGHVYEFPGYEDNSECTYILAHDFMDGNLTLLVKKFSTILVTETCTVEIAHGRFHINGNPMPQSPPFESPEKDVLVTRDGPWINVTSTHGIELNCHEDNNMCIYRLSGWYYGKTQGLLGNLDTEHFNELTKPDGTIATSLVDFANSYEVSGLPSCILPADFGIRPEPGCPELDTKCETLFQDDSSYLMPIFETINPLPFLEACKKNAVKCVAADEFVDAYITLARVEGVFIDIPGCANAELTVPCTYPRPALEPADIVFIISEKMGMVNEISASDLKANIKNIYVSIRSNYPNSHFGLVAYGGEEYEHCAPHLHSNEMEFFTNENFATAVESLQFCSGETCSCASAKGDALKAIEYSSQLALRDTAGKIFVLIDDMEKEYKESQRLAAADILTHNGITFNVISSYSQFEKTIGKVPVIGVNYDGRALFNKRNSAETTMEVMNIPKGAYAKLATATDGAMMGINYLRDGHDDLKQVLKKSFRMQLLTYADKNVICKSVWDMYGRPSSRCAEL